MKKIALYGEKGKGKYIFLDNEDFGKVNQYKWYYESGYATNKSWLKPKIRIHQLILKSKNNKEIDHINGNGLDNRKCNLRLVSHKNNSINRKINKNNSSGFKGVSFKKDIHKWQSSIRVNYKIIYLGYFKTAKEGAIAYNQAALKYFGQYARLNSL